MTATEVAIRPHDILTIEPEAIIPMSSIIRDQIASERRGREFIVYLAPSKSTPGFRHLVTVNTKTQTIYCTCQAAERGIKCRHAKSVLFHTLYDETFRLYHACTLDELQEQDRTLGRMERGTLVPVRGWRAIKAAIGDLILHRTEVAA